MTGRRERTAERNSTWMTRKRTRSSSLKNPLHSGPSHGKGNLVRASMDCSRWNFLKETVTCRNKKPSHVPFPSSWLTDSSHLLLCTLNVKLRTPHPYTLNITVDSCTCGNWWAQLIITIVSPFSLFISVLLCLCFCFNSSVNFNYVSCWFENAIFHEGIFVACFF